MNAAQAVVGDRAAVGLVPEVFPREKELSVVDAFSLPKLIKRVQEELSFQEHEAMQVVTEYFAFIKLKIACKDWEGGKLSPCSKVEKVWRVQLLDTVDYLNGCEALCQRTLHHHPNDSKDQNFNKRIEYTRTFYREHFGFSPPAAIWVEENRVPQANEVSINIKTLTGKSIGFMLT